MSSSFDKRGILASVSDWQSLLMAMANEEGQERLENAPELAALGLKV